MQTPGEVAARYSFLFPIGESRRFKPSHPTIRAMCVNGTLSLASLPRRPRDLLPHSAQSPILCQTPFVCRWVTGDGLASSSSDSNELCIPRSASAVSFFICQSFSRPPQLLPDHSPMFNKGELRFGKNVASFPFRFITCVVSPAGRGSSSRR